MVTKGGTTDQSRYDETKSMVEQAKVIADPLGVPVVYAGDFNSDLADSHSFNGPSDYMLPNGMVDSFDAAQSRTNAQYDSANNYRTTPPAHHLRIDYLYVSPGVGVDSWDMHLDLNHGKQAGVIPSDHNAVTANLLIPYSPVS
jgi:endonuclease/exonuclease/phosphatase family metal-dependent hydrolase